MAAPTRAPTVPLAGLTLPLAPGPALQLTVSGHLGGDVATVQFDPATPLSLVSRRCATVQTLPSLVRIVEPFAPDRTLPIVRVEGLDLGTGRLAGFDAGLVDEPRCLVVLGSDVLSGLALLIRPVERLLRLVPSRSREAWLQALPPDDDVEVVPLTREPRYDWPLVAVHINQGPARFSGPLLFSTLARRTRLLEGPARAAGLKPGVELLQGLALPEGLALPPRLQALRAFAVDRVALSALADARDVAVELVPGAARHMPLGVLGADVWGRFNAVVDVGQGLLLLHRPRVQDAGTRPRCARDGEVSEERCFELTQRRMGRGMAVGLAIWRALPEGGRVTLDVEGGEAPCRVGVSVPPSDRGRISFHLFPWDALTAAMPACAAHVAHAPRIEPGLFEEGPLPECSGACAYAQERTTGRILCECEPMGPALDEAAERELLILYRRLLERAPRPSEPEPSDPD